MGLVLRRNLNRPLTIAEWDGNFEGLANGTFLFPFSPYEEGSRSLREVIADFVNVKNPPYGAMGDGVTDDTTAIQDAIDSLSSGGIVWFPPGSYITSADLDVAVDGINLMGAGRAATILKGNHTDGPIIRIRRSYCSVRGMMVWGTATRIAAAAGSNFGIHIEPDDAADTISNRTRYFRIEDVRIAQQPSHGIAVVGGTTNGSIISQCYIQSNGGHGVVIDRGELTSRTTLAGSGPVAIGIGYCEIHGNGGNAVACGSPTDTATTPTARIVLDNLDIASNATNASIRYDTHQVWVRGTNCTIRNCGIASDGTAEAIFIAGRNHKIENQRSIECTASVQIGDFTALSGLSTQGIEIGGLSVITAAALAQDPAVIIDSGVSRVSIKNWLPSNITTLHTAGFQVEVDRTPQIVIKPSDTVVNNSATLADDPTLKFWMAASETIYFRAVMQYTGDSSADIQAAITCPSGGAIRYGVPGNLKVDTADAVAIQNDIAASGTAITFGSSTSRRNITLQGSCVNGATAGYLQVQWAQAAAVVADTTVYANSSSLTVYRKP